MTPAPGALPTLGRRAKRQPSARIPDRANVLALCSLLLDYPDAELLQWRARLALTADGLANSAPANELREFTRWFAAADGAEITRHYVQIFDLRRSSGLYLTYYHHGDGRTRGMALLAIRQRYRMADFSPSPRELADYLPTVLQFAAQCEQPGLVLLRIHRSALDQIHAALAEEDSPYAHVLRAILTVVGAAAGGAAQRAHRPASSPVDEFPSEDAELPGESEVLLGLTDPFDNLEAYGGPPSGVPFAKAGHGGAGANLSMYQESRS